MARDVTRYEKLMLGDSLETILAEERRTTPFISEYQFERDVVDILANPFGPDALRRYSQYVGELTKALNVLDNTDHTKIILTVPALVQAPQTSIPYGRGLTAENFFNSLHRDAELGGYGLNDKITNFLMRMTRVPNYVETVIQPIQAIVARYGRQMVEIPGVPAYRPTATAGTVTPEQTSFSDDYVD